MTDFNVGPGVLQAMTDNGDEPRSDELYVITTEGHKVSETYSTGGLYIYYEEDNATRRCPFR